MKFRKRTLWRLFWITAAGITAAGLILPTLDAGRFRGRVKQSLSEALGREVEVGEVHLDLFNGPGFSVDRVVIHDDPAAGIEPFAYVESLQARVSFASFWTGRLKFASLRLVNPSVNLVRPEGGQWNILPLLGRTAGTPGRARLPEIQVRGGRINFKFGDRKSIFYLGDASLDASPPPSDGGEWRVRFQGAPARTDRAAQRYGAISARGRWRPDPASGGAVDISVELERTSLGESIRLIHGHDIGVHGQVSSRVRLRGPVSEIAIEGRLEVSDIHRWDLLPPYAGFWPFDFRGRLDLLSQTLDVDSLQTQPVGFSVRASGFLGQPRWGTIVTVRSMPAGEALSIARQMGLSVPEQVQAAGDLTGVVGYSPRSGLAGMIGTGRISAQMPGTPELWIGRGEAIIDSAGVRLLPAALSVGTDPLGRLEGEYSWRSQTFDIVLAARSAGIPETVAAANVLGGAPVLEHCSKGTWKGLLRYQRRSGEDAGQWSGVVDVEDAKLEVDGLADPAVLASARIGLGESGISVERMRGAAGAVSFSGEYRHRPGATRPHRLRLRLASAEAGELERLLDPTLRRDEGFLTRALRLGRSRIPDWLAGRRAEVSFEIGTVTGTNLTVRKVRGRAVWNGPDVEITGFAAQVGGMSLTGDVTANLRGAVPAYRLKGGFQDLVWAGGEWKGAGVLGTSGMGAALLRNLKLDLGFSGRSVKLADDAQFSTISGRCTVSLPRGAPVLEFSKIRATAGDETFQGKGGTGPDGHVLLELNAAGRDLHLAGTAWPLKLEMRP